MTALRHEAYWLFRGWGDGESAAKEQLSGVFGVPACLHLSLIPSFRVKLDIPKRLGGN
jgi:hypothetical protein